MISSTLALTVLSSVITLFCNLEETGNIRTHSTENTQNKPSNTREIDENRSSLTYSWPRFRGPNGSGLANVSVFPVQINESKALWKKEIDGSGTSSACCIQDRIYYTQADSQGHFRLNAVNLNTGDILWTFERSITPSHLHKKNTFATSTPAADERAVVVTLVSADSYRIFAIDRNGKLKWEKNLGLFDSQHGYGSSPIIWNGHVIVTNEQKGDSFIESYSLDDGKSNWKIERPSGKAGYSTPAILANYRLFDLSLTDAIVFTTSGQGIWAADSKTGDKLWEVEGFDQRAVGSPIVSESLIVATCGSGRKGSMLLAALTNSKITNHDRLSWKIDRSIPYCPSPLILKDRTYWITEDGRMTCVENASGDVKWNRSFQGSFYSSPIAINELLLISSEQGDVYILDPKADGEIVQKEKLEDRFIATTAVCMDRLIFRGEKNIWVFSTDQK